MSNRFFGFVATLSMSFIAATAACCEAKDYFLTIGGGYDPSGNQISLEKNVLFQQSVLASKRPDKPLHEVWFADGSDPSPDVQCRNPKFAETCPLARQILAEVLGDPDSMDLYYRNNEVPSLKGASDLKRVKQRFADLASDVKSGDRVIIYVAGHGGKASRPGRGRRAERAKANAYNTSFYFWNTEPVTVSEFATWLDRFPRGAQVVLVMVQCYAGGFAHTIFNKADANAGLSPSDRCGFFAQLHDRGAAGCTPDANDSDYEEYSSYFWGALAGKSRVGKTVDTADYDKNGQVSFAEAHAYAIIESDTIDVPVRASGALLQQYSELSKPTRKAGSAENVTGASNKDAAEFAELKGPLSKLAATCRPDQRAILAQLTVKLGLGATSTIEDVRKKLEQVEDKIESADSKLSAATRTRRNALKAVRNELYKIWPELRAEYAPLAIELASDRADEFVGHVQRMPDYDALRDAKKEESELTKASMQVEREKARCERLLQACEYAVLAANLPRIAKPEIVKRYDRLIAMEEGTLADPSNSNSPAQAAISFTE
jgi:hypothetical protein